MTKTNLKLILPSIIITVIFAFVLAFLISQAINNYLMQSFHDTLSNSIYASLEYSVDGDVVLKQALANESFNIYCDAASNNQTLSNLGEDSRIEQSAELIDNCLPQHLFIELPANSVFSIATPHNLRSISIWDNKNNLVHAIPSTTADRLNKNKAKQQLSLNWKFNSDVINIPNTDVYRQKFQFSFLQPENENMLFTVPILNGAKTDTLGYIAVYIQAPQTDTWDVVSYLLPSVLPLAIVISLLGAILFSRNLRRQVAELQQVTAAWSIGDFRPKVVTRSDDEIGKLGADLNQMADQLEDLLEAKATVASLEAKQEVARDLHDAAKQQLFAATMQLDAAKTLFSANPEEAQKHLADAAKLTKMAQQELAAVIKQLGPVQMQSQTFEAAIIDLVDSFSNRQNILVDLDVSTGFEASAEIEKGLFRVLQESLSNIAKHSKAKNVQIKLGSDNTQVSLMVEDDGTGLNRTEMDSGFGLQSMDQRIKLLGGTFQIQDRENQGTRISIQIPK